jgi:hypothetical protein
MLGVLYTFHYCPDKSGGQAFLCFVFANLGVIFELNRSFIPQAPNSRDRLIVIIKQRAIAITAFDALNKMINSIAKLQYLSNCKLSPCREIVKEQYQATYNFIYLCGGDLRPLNHQVVLARRDFRDAGMDVIQKHSSICRLLDMTNGSNPNANQDPQLVLCKCKHPVEYLLSTFFSFLNPFNLVNTF